MSDEYTPTTEEVRRHWGIAVDLHRRAERLAEFDAWLAEEKAKAWDEGRLAEELAWHHALDGHPVPEGEMCDECAVVNPYRKAVA